MKWTLCAVLFLGCSSSTTQVPPPNRPSEKVAPSETAMACAGHSGIVASFPGSLSACPLATQDTPVAKRTSVFGDARFHLQYWSIPQPNAELPTASSWKGAQTRAGEYRGHPSLEYKAGDAESGPWVLGRTVLAGGYLISIEGQYKDSRDEQKVSAFINSLSIGL